MTVYLLIALTVAIIAAWIISPQFREFVDGYKTRVALAVSGVLQIADVIDPHLITGALGFPPGTKEFSLTILALTVAGILFHEMSNGPGALSKKDK